MDYQQRMNHRSRAHRAAGGLGLFSIGLGVAELLFAPAFARAFGMRGGAALIRLYGLREIATGIGILSARDREPWVWARVAGDGLDLATLGAHVPDNRQSRNVALAIGAVAGVAAMDMMTAQSLARVERLERRPAADYSDRSGFPMGVEAARGAARGDFEMPRDLATPEAMRPLH